MRLPISFTIVFFLSMSCASDGGSTSQDDIGGGGGGGGDGDGDGDSMMSECMPIEGAVDVSTLPACCEGMGAAHCVPDSAIPTEFQESLSVCEGGGLCVPDELIESAGTYQPAACTAGAFGPGACLSVCIKAVSDNAAFLAQDVCAAGELCAPCMIGDMPTGACEIGGCS